jgi:hypothetical protein
MTGRSTSRDGRVFTDGSSGAVAQPERTSTGSHREEAIGPVTFC